MEKTIYIKKSGLFLYLKNLIDNYSHLKEKQFEVPELFFKLFSFQLYMRVFNILVETIYRNKYKKSPNLNDFAAISMKIL